jgi:hypothetical protein
VKGVGCRAYGLGFTVIVWDSRLGLRLWRFRALGLRI